MIFKKKKNFLILSNPKLSARTWEQKRARKCCTVESVWRAARKVELKIPSVIIHPYPSQIWNSQCIIYEFLMRVWKMFCSSVRVRLARSFFGSLFLILSRIFFVILFFFPLKKMEHRGSEESFFPHTQRTHSGKVEKVEAYRKGKRSNNSETETKKNCDWESQLVYLLLVVVIVAVQRI